MKLKYFLILLTCSLSTLHSQDFSKVDKLALQIPDSLTQSSQGIANYINSKFTNNKDKSRAIFIWIAKNIQYDIDNMFAINFYQSKSEIINNILKNKKGICMHYAELFNDIANKTNIKSFVITGYTKQNGFVGFIPHAWCGAQIDSAWFFFDPTWGSGYVENGKFIKQVNNYYYKTKPEQLIKSHMPFDPLWQFLNSPVTHQNFYDGKTQVDNKKSSFNFTDTLKLYESQSEIERYVSESNRIEKNEVKNSLLFDRLQHIKREIEYYNNKKHTEEQNAKVKDYNSATVSYNEGINLLNAFIQYRNTQFKPKKSDEEIKNMIPPAEEKLIESKLILDGIKEPEVTILGLIKALNKSTDDAINNLNEQKTFLKKYFNTAKPFRKSLFYKYTWMGIPIN
ncbi:MAG: hypothetical protein HY841_15370 [Bacteroidetes bacterium]|nr:hypothetical protein [Bacteroidota bacterium]